MLARDNYSYRKYQKELAKKKKREEKSQRKLDRKNIQSKEVEAQALNEDSRKDSEAAQGPESPSTT